MSELISLELGQVSHLELVDPPLGGTQRLPRVVRLARTKELILTGRIISAEQAERIGLVNEVVRTGEARMAARAMANEIAARGPIAVREAKRLIDAAPDTTLDASEHIFESEDMLEGAKAFFEKRDPQYRGR